MPDQNTDTQTYDAINFENVDWQTLIRMNQYDEESLRIIAEFVDLRVLLKTQVMSLDLIYDLFLNPERKEEQSCEEKYVTISEITHYQKITREEIDQYVKKKMI